MSRPEYVPEVPMELGPPGVAEMLASPEHYRRVEMHVVDYSQVAPEAGPVPGWEPLFSAQPPPEPEPPSRWARLRKAWRGT